MGRALIQSQARHGRCSPEAESESLHEMYSASLDEIRRESNLLRPKLVKRGGSRRRAGRIAGYREAKELGEMGKEYFRFREL